MSNELLVTARLTCLTEVYDRFTKASIPLHLKDAKALLDELSG